MKTELIKPKKNKNKLQTPNLLVPIAYLIIGVMLAFFSNEAVKLIFYVIGIIIIAYGIKSLVEHYRNKESIQFQKMDLSIGIISVVVGLLIILLSDALETSIRYIIGFFLIYIGISRILTSISFNNYKNFSTLSNIVLIILGIYSIFVSNAVLLIIGWVLIAYSILLFIDYWRS